MQAMLRVVGSRDPERDFRSLRDWLSEEPELRGGVQVADRPVRPGEMGAIEDVLMVAVGGGGAATVLARSVAVWLQRRRSGMSVRITAPDGTHVEITGAGPAADQIAKTLGLPQPE